MTNHFHSLVRVPDAREVEVSDEELMRRYRVLYPQPTQYQVAWAEVLRETLKAGGEEADALRQRLLLTIAAEKKMELGLESPAFGIAVELRQERVVVGDLLNERISELLGETTREAGFPDPDRPLD